MPGEAGPYASWFRTCGSIHRLPKRQGVSMLFYVAYILLRRQLTTEKNNGTTSDTGGDVRAGILSFLLLALLEEVSC